MHINTNSDITSLPMSTPPRSPPKRVATGAAYFVESPPHHEMDKLMTSNGSTPLVGSPARNYNRPPTCHSRESPTTLCISSTVIAHRSGYSDDELETRDFDDRNDGNSVRFYVVCCIGLFALFSLILWGASRSFRPLIFVQNMVVHDFNIQAGMDDTGVPTEKLSLNSTVGILYKNPATFFGVHVTSSPLELFYYDLKVASGQMKKFYQKRKSQSKVTTGVQGTKFRSMVECRLYQVQDMATAFI